MGTCGEGDRGQSRCGGPPGSPPSFLPLPPSPLAPRYSQPLDGRGEPQLAEQQGGGHSGVAHGWGQGWGWGWGRDQGPRPLYTRGAAVLPPGEGNKGGFGAIHSSQPSGRLPQPLSPSLGTLLVPKVASPWGKSHGGTAQLHERGGRGCLGSALRPTNFSAHFSAQQGMGEAPAPQALLSQVSGYHLWHLQESHWTAKQTRVSLLSR